MLALRNGTFAAVELFYLQKDGPGIENSLHLLRS
jgi:hypothetical protein